MTEQHGHAHFVKRVAMKVAAALRQPSAVHREFHRRGPNSSRTSFTPTIVPNLPIWAKPTAVLHRHGTHPRVNLEQFAQQHADKLQVLPRNWPCSLSAAWPAGLATRIAKTDKDGKPLVSFTAMSASEHHDRIRGRREVRTWHRQGRGFLADQEGEVVAGKPTS